MTTSTLEALAEKDNYRITVVDGPRLYMPDVREQLTADNYNVTSITGPQRELPRKHGKLDGTDERAVVSVVDSFSQFMVTILKYNPPNQVVFNYDRFEESMVLMSVMGKGATVGGVKMRIFATFDATYQDLVDNITIGRVTQIYLHDLKGLQRRFTTSDCDPRQTIRDGMETIEQYLFALSKTVDPTLQQDLQTEIQRISQEVQKGQHQYRGTSKAPVLDELAVRLQLMEKILSEGNLTNSGSA